VGAEVQLDPWNEGERVPAGKKSDHTCVKVKAGGGRTKRFLDAGLVSNEGWLSRGGGTHRVVCFGNNPMSTSCKKREMGENSVYRCQKGNSSSTSQSTQFLSMGKGWKVFTMVRVTQKAPWEKRV